MAPYAVTTTTYGPDTLAVVTAAMEAYIETVDTTKTIRLYTVSSVARDRDMVVGAIVHNT